MTTEQQAARAAFIARPTAKGMSTEQKAYCWALAAHQLASEAATAEMKSIPEPPIENDDAVVAYCDRYEKANESHGVNEAAKLLREAEELLIAWGREVISRHKDSAKLPADFWEKAAQSVNVRRQLIDLTMRLDAASWQRVTANEGN